MEEMDMAAINTFEWYLGEFFPHPDTPTEELLRARRRYLMDIRSEDERKRYVDELVEQARAERRR